MSQENLTTETYQGNDAKVKAARDIFKYVMLKLTNLRSFSPAFSVWKYKKGLWSPQHCKNVKIKLHTVAYLQNIFVRIVHNMQPLDAVW